MDRYLTASEARGKLFRLIDEVGEGDQIAVTKHGVPKAVIMNFEHLRNLKALVRLWQDPEALEAIRASMDDLKKGKKLRLSGILKVGRILASARKKGLLRG